MKKKLLKFLASIALPLIAGSIGSIVTIPAIDSWYVNLTKPVFNPPNWIFSPVWTILYVLMGLALFIVWQKGWNKKIKFAFWFFVIHLIFNSLWSILFFDLESPLYGLIDIVILWAMIIYLIYLFGNIERKAAYLLIPYFLWVSFAMILNFRIWQLN